MICYKFESKLGFQVGKGLAIQLPQSAPTLLKADWFPTEMKAGEDKQRTREGKNKI